MSQGLTPENFSQGFLLDEELLGGVSELKQPEAGAEPYLAFVLRHTTGEYLGQQRFASLTDALDVLNRVQRPWRFERTKACGGVGPCNGGNCAAGGCGSKPGQDAASATPACDTNACAPAQA